MVVTPAWLRRFSSLVFDCDGVLLNSNRVKTEAFAVVARRWGPDAERLLVSHHLANGGLSRYRKFEYFQKSILGQDPDAKLQHQLLAAFAAEVQHGLAICEVAPGLRALRTATSSARWFVASGGDEFELRAIFASRGLDDLFDGGIFGSPAEKSEIIRREVARGNLILPGVFFGDARADWEAASENGLSFVFVEDWSEMPNWPQFCAKEGINSIAQLSRLLVSPESDA